MFADVLVGLFVLQRLGGDQVLWNSHHASRLSKPGKISF